MVMQNVGSGVEDKKIFMVFFKVAGDILCHLYLIV